MNDLRQAAMQQALEALEKHQEALRVWPEHTLAPHECVAMDVSGKAITALRTAMAQEPCEPLEVLKRALEIIAVGDSKNPQQDAAAALVDIGFWSGGAAR